MKKKLISLLLATAMVATLAACGGETNSNEGAGTGDDSQGGAATEDVVANLIANTEGTVELSVWAAENDQQMVTDWCNAFAAQYPDVTFNFTVGVSSESTTKDTVLTDVEAAADVFSFAGDQLTALVNAGALQEVTINTDKVIEALGGKDAGSVQAATVDGKLYAYPATADNGYFMFYNKEYFTEEDVKTLDGMLKVAADNGKSVTFELDNGWYNLGFFVGAGFEISRNADGSTNMNWNGTSASGISGKDVAQAMLDIASNPGYKCLSDAAFATGIQEGTVIAGVNGTWNANVAAEAWGENYAATCLPTYTCNGEQVQIASVAGYKMFGVNPYCDNVGWAMLLAEYFTAYEQQVNRFELAEAGPANVAAAASDAVQANPAIAALASQSKYAILDGCEGDNYWAAAQSFGAILVQGNPDGTDLQTLLDNLVDAASQPTAQ